MNEERRAEIERTVRALCEKAEFAAALERGRARQ